MRNDGSRPLTRLEIELLQVILDGNFPTTAQLARLRGVSPHTIHTELGHIYAKLGVHSRLAAVLEALDRGLIHRQDDGDGGS
jgi:DNA-binding CsgD family transcriptional regulator